MAETSDTAELPPSGTKHRKERLWVIFVTAIIVLLARPARLSQEVAIVRPDRTQPSVPN